MAPATGDRAFTGALRGSAPELVYAGATSFCRRRYTRELAGADVVVTGIPWDSSTTYRPGTRLGPRAIRTASANLCFGAVWPWNFDPFDTLAVVDRGDVVSYEGDWASLCVETETVAREVFASGAKLLSLGGDHAVSLPLLRAAFAQHGPLALVHFDAHSDTWDDDHEHHGTMFRTALAEGLIDADRSIQVGLRTYNRDDCGIEILTAPWVHAAGPHAVAERIRGRVGDAAAYLTVDIDCLDPAYAPGTGTPVVGGLTTAQMQQIFYGLVGVRFVAMDVVEVSPPYDHAELAALAAATLALDWLCALAADVAPDPYQGGSGRTTPLPA